MKKSFSAGLALGVFVLALLAATVPSPPYLHTWITTNATVGTFAEGESPIWNSTAKKWSNGVASALQGEVNVASFGADPTGVADSTIAITNALFAGKTIRITQPGTYLVTNTLYVSSGQSLLCDAGVFLKKNATFTHVIANQNAGVGGTNWDGNITLKGISIIQNGHDGATVGSLYGAMRGMVQLAFVTNVVIEGLECLDGGTAQFMLGATMVDGLKVSRVHYVGDKSPIQFEGGTRNVVVDGFDISSKDDSFAVNINDYPSVVIRIDDSENIIFQNGVLRPYSGVGETGNALRFIAGSWTNWVSGSNYQTGSVAVNAGNIYKMTNPAGTTNTASVAPTHTGGIVTGADGIAWRWLQTGTQTNCHIRNVTLKNVDWQTAKTGLLIDSGADVNNQPVYPSTEGQGTVENITVSKCDITGAKGVDPALFDATGRIINLTLHKINQRGAPRYWYADNTNTWIDSLNFVKCQFNASDSMVLATRGWATNVTFQNCNLPTTNTVSGNITMVAYLYGSTLWSIMGGQFGIGTRSPIYSFMVSNTIPAQDNFAVFANGNPVPQITVRSNGNVGIGTNVPQAALEIMGTTRITGLLSMVGNPISGVTTQSWNNGGKIAQNDPVAFALSFYSGATPTRSTTWGSNSFFGIGTNRPQTVLHVTGDGRGSLASFGTTLKDNLLNVDTNGVLVWPTNTITTPPTLALGSFAYWCSNGLMLWKCWNTNGTTVCFPTTP